MKPCLSQISTLHATFAEDLQDYSAAKCNAIEVWLTKLETYLRDHTLDDVRRLLDAHEMTLPVASGQGGLLTSQGAARGEAWKLFDGRLRLCRELGIGTIVVACDPAESLTQTDLDRLMVSLRDAARRAAEYDVRLALEFQARATFGNNLETAAALVEQTGEENLGICLDMFHFTVGPSKTEDFRFLSVRNLFHVQVCGLIDRPRELAADADRLLPGEGEVPNEQLAEVLRAINYGGHVSIELMNPVMWRVSGKVFAEIALTSLRTLLGQARME